MNGPYVYRATYGDTAPVRVHMTQALAFDGGLLEGHYQSEEAAWGGILSCAEDDLRAVEDARQRVLAEISVANRECIQVRGKYRAACAAFDAWKAKHPKQAAVAV